MKNRCIRLFAFISVLAIASTVSSQDLLKRKYENTQISDSWKTDENAKPWVYWYWMNASVSKPGIRADLLAMKEQGLAGAYLMPINGRPDSLLINPAVVQLTPIWWSMLDYTMKLADSLHFNLAIHVADGFATAGGPWITPELSMQKLVWSKIEVNGDNKTLFDDSLPRPELAPKYYRDIAVFAYPSLLGDTISTDNTHPEVTTSIANVDASYLTDTSNTKNFSSSTACSITYQFEKPFTCRRIVIRIKGVNHQAKRLVVSSSNDGISFKKVEALQPSRSGWQDYTEPITYSLRPTTATYFRFSFDPKGTEPGAEDLDAAKWSPKLKICGISLYSSAGIQQIEGKNGSIWRIAERTTKNQVPDSLCVPLKSIQNITGFMNRDGHLKWKMPKGNWTILRIGHASTDQTNATAGGGRGLECDKFNPEAVRLQFNSWFNKIYHKTGEDISQKVLKIFHVDSWEAGSQNWSVVFRSEFIKRRGYDPLPLLLICSGVPVQSASFSEKFLYDMRTTIADLIADNFFGTLKTLAHQSGCLFSAESVAPTMVSDGMLHYKNVDLPMGEYWLRSPTHDKPSDILDAISAGHIYGKKIIQAESFTELRNEWDEYPGMLKTLQDRNFALGINRMVFHVYNENPWLDRKPGMTLGGVGLFFQRDQSWWKPAKAWIDYTRRCQYLLQQGTPVTDLVVYTGEEIPRRSVLPDRLVSTLPGIFGKEVVEKEALRLKNKGNPMWQKPKGVSSSTGITTPADWINPLHGYHYDCINRDAFCRLTKQSKGFIDLPSGASYQLLVVPLLEKMDPSYYLMNLNVAKKLLELVKSGATVLMNRYPVGLPGLGGNKDTSFVKTSQLNSIIKELMGDKYSFESNQNHPSKIPLVRKVGEGRVITGAFQQSTFESLGIKPDILFNNIDGNSSQADQIAWTHRRVVDSTDINTSKDIYFISNQEQKQRTVQVSFRVSGKNVMIYDPVTDQQREAHEWNSENGYTNLILRLDPNGSLFIIFNGHSDIKQRSRGKNWDQQSLVKIVNSAWSLNFVDPFGKLIKKIMTDSLFDWSKSTDPMLRYFSGTATYSQNLRLDAKEFSSINKGSDTGLWLSLGVVKDIARVRVNGKDCGVTWTFPYKVNITNALKTGDNLIEIETTNTWANRLIGDHQPDIKRPSTWTTAPYYLDGMSPLSSGLLGPVSLIKEWY